MTKKELLAKIKVEVERQRSMFIDDEYYTTLTDSLDEILEFLDKLEKEITYLLSAQNNRLMKEIDF